MSVGVHTNYVVVRKNGIGGWPWTVCCSNCVLKHDTPQGINSVLGWESWDAAIKRAFRHAEECFL